MSRRVVITGLGCISGLGVGCRLFWEAISAGRSGIRPLSGLPLERLQVRMGAQIPGYDAENWFPPDALPLLDPFAQYAVLAAREAVADAGLDSGQIGSAAVIVGTGCGGKVTDEETYDRLYRQGKLRAHPLTIPRGMPSAAASQVSMQLGIFGPVFSVTSACSSAAHAAGQGLLLIRSGGVELALVGGTDAPFTEGLLKSWEALRVLSPDNCRPFSRDRNGLVLGEGAGILVLESLEHARRRGARIYAELAGSGMSADAGHITDPSPDGAARAMRAALADAGMALDEVDYINAHGTGTRANDVNETRAIEAVMGARAPALMVSSTKSMHGHALGAAGALEMIATALALAEGLVPPTANFTEPGDGCNLDYVPNRARECRLGAALSNSFAFGGLNAVLALRAMR